MLNGLFKLIVAALIAFGIVTYVTGGDYAQVKTAANEAMEQALARKNARAAAVETADAPETAEPETNVIDVVTKISRAQPLESTLTLTGSTEASRTVDVRAETSGIVLQAQRKGARVRKGDLLCQLDIGDRKARREAGIARLNQALVQARAQKTLSEKGFAASNTSSAAKTDAEVIRAEIMQIDLEIANLQIRAPFDGVVEGSTVEIGALLQMGNTCAQIMDPDPLRVVGFVPEFRIGALRLGNPATANLITGQKVQGGIVYIAQSADSATRTFKVEVEVPNSDYSLRDAVTADIEFPLDTKLAHKLPQSSMTLGDSGEIGVMVAEGGKAKFRKVEILRDDTNGVWVTGLDNQATVIVVGQEYVSDGSTIKATPQDGNILGTQS